MSKYDPTAPITISPEPVRKVIKRSGRADSSFFSRKMKKWIPAESAGERAFIRLAELDPSITEIYAQPIKLLHRSRHGAQVAYPDFAIMIDGEWEFHEVKDANDYADPFTKEKLFWVGTELRSKGYAYSVTLSECIKPLAFSEPVEDLLRRLATEVPAAARMTVLRLGQQGPLTVRSFLKEAPSLKFYHVEAMIAHGDLWADVRIPLHLDSAVYPPGCGRFERLIPFTPPVRPIDLPRWVA
ncbi:hypothetical protein GCM10007925_13490 [Sphingomonas astaxanthinifaciens DSM 22298]|uniref:TnsA endonuclease N-terminal domain-containing protein n=2 Tax=Sphingomonas TaxID=13687 RepID=A0ABQ5Z7Y1_9SPHN|nr:hypothetical protein GCM10007925_13490 [Sphingomonas astaxanthinifaciens DSM 22298]